MTASWKILFLPVSGCRGMGEYARSLCIAQALQKNTDIEIAFAISREAKYLKSCPLQTYELSASPTLCTPEVLAIIDEFKPNLVFFDASGRATQLEYCRNKGIKTVCMAQHDKKLRRALSLRRLRFTDKVFVAQDEALCRPLNRWHLIKLAWLKKPLPDYVGPIYNEQGEREQIACLNAYGLTSGAYIFLNAGGGGNFISSKSGDVLAVDFLCEFSRTLSEKTDLKIVLVAGKNYSGQLKISDQEAVVFIDACESETFNTLMRHARVNIVSGGSALLQALACGKRDIVALPVANDQKARIKACEKQFGIESSACAKDELLTRTLKLLASPRGDERCDKAGKPEQALTRIVQELQRLLGLSTEAALREENVG